MISTNPESRCGKIPGQFTNIQYTVAIWSSLKEKDCSSIKPGRSQSISIAICIERVVSMKTGEDSYCKVHQSPGLPRVVLTPNSQQGRQDPHNSEARTFLIPKRPSCGGCSLLVSLPSRSSLVSAFSLSFFGVTTQRPLISCCRRWASFSSLRVGAMSGRKQRAPNQEPVFFFHDMCLHGMQLVMPYLGKYTAAIEKPPEPIGLSGFLARFGCFVSGGFGGPVCPGLCG